MLSKKLPYDPEIRAVTSKTIFMLGLLKEKDENKDPTKLGSSMETP